MGQAMVMGSRRRRVFLLGLDGATFTLLRPWADEGHLPTLARLMAGGTWGVLRSTVPPVTPVAWASIVTGVYPGKHGVFSFFTTRPGSYESEVISSHDRRRPAIWNLLGLAGLRSIAVDIPFTYPPEVIDGIMIAGMGTPDVTSAFVHPTPLREAIIREFGPYPLDVYYRGDVPALLEDARRLTEHRVALARFLMREFSWDFFMLVLTSLDRIQHVVWRYVDPGHPGYTPEEARRYGPAILGYYKALDDSIARLLNGLDAGTAFLIASDHGFGPLEQRPKLSLKGWLQRSGLLVLGRQCWTYSPPEHVPEFTVFGSGRVTQHNGGPGEKVGLTLEVDKSDSFAGVLFRIPNLDPGRRYDLKARAVDATPGVLLELYEQAEGSRHLIGGGTVGATPLDISTVFQPRAQETGLYVGMTTYGGNPTGQMTVSALVLTEREDWSRTRAYLMDAVETEGGRRIRLNVRGREPQGVVEPGEEYDRLREEIAAALLALRDTAGRPLVRHVRWGEELYPGPYAGQGPDLMVFFEPGGPDTAGVDAPAERAPDGLVGLRATKGYTGDHHPDGVFIAHGDGIAAGKTISAKIVDVCPTILHLLGVPIPTDVDGRVLFEMLAPRRTEHTVQSGLDDIA